jgi:hypothetical protein
MTQKQTGQHCPFLNRSDARCVENFSLDRLKHSLRHCFGNYAACPTYIELLVERRTRRAAAAAASASASALAVNQSNDGRPVVQVFVHGRNARKRPPTAPSGGAIAAV